MKVKIANESTIREAAQIIKKGGLVAFPTETVYGLGADAFNPEAVAGIYAAKGRPADNPLILHVNDVETVMEITDEIKDYAKALIAAFWPGPLTLVFKKKPSIPGWVGGHPQNSRNTVAIRSPQNAVARQLIAWCGCAIAAPSANKAGTPSPTSATHVEKDFCNDDVFILDGGETIGGLESTVVDVTGNAPVILRPGIITEEMITSVCLQHGVDNKAGGAASVENNLRIQLNKQGGYCVSDANEQVVSLGNYYNEEKPPLSPGMKYRHYAPAAPMNLICGGCEEVSAYIIKKVMLRGGRVGILATHQTEANYHRAFEGRRNFGGVPAPGSGNAVENQNIAILIMGDRNRPESIAHNLYACLRRFDELGVEEIFAEGVSEAGLGKAIMNRMGKAAEGRVIWVN